MLTWEQIKPYLELNGTMPRAELLHPFYNKSVKYSKSLKSIFGDDYPSFMNVIRPRESDDHRKYRQEIFSNPVKFVSQRVFGFVKSIQQSADYAVRYAEEKDNDDSFKDYVTEHFGVDGNLEDWVWNDSVDLMKYDPNGVMVLVPKLGLSEMDRIDVIGKLLPCENVWQLKKGEFAVIESDEKFPLANEIYETQYTGKLIYFFDKESFVYAKQVSKQTNNSGNYYTWEVLGLTTTEVGNYFKPMLHYCDGLPVVKVGRILEEQKESKKYEFFVSELEQVKTNLIKAIRRDSDHEVEAITSTSTLNWRVSTDCKQCDGKGKIKNYENGDSSEVTCNVCKGSGISVPRTALDIATVSIKEVEGWTDKKQFNPIIPPGGSVQNTPTNLLAMRKEFEDEIKNAFSGMGLGTFNYLNLNQSGTAKREDKEEGIRFGVNMTNHICTTLLEWAFWCVASMRYGISGNQKLLMPSVNKPTRFNLDSIDEIRSQLKEAIESEMDSGVVDTFQLKLLRIEAGEDSLEFKRYNLRMILDGYRGMTEQQKWFAIANLMTLGDRKSESFANVVKAYQFSINFDKIYQDAIIEHFDFDTLSISDKSIKMLEIAKKYETVKPANEAIEQIIQQPAVNVRDIKQV